MKWTIRHYYDFGADAQVIGASLASDVAWDRLRLDTTLDAFSLPRDRDAWLRLCEADQEARRRAHDVARVVVAGRYRTVVSVGVGRAHLEYWLKREQPDLKLTCLDYTARTVGVLRGLFVECDAMELFDLRTTRWPIRGPDTLYLLCRLDTELNNDEWAAVFGRMAVAHIDRVLFVATGFIKPRTLVQEAARHLAGALHLRRPVFAGYLRTKSAFRQLWRPSYREIAELRVGACSAFLLANESVT